jgi:PAS domain S-box-containing protein
MVKSSATNSRKTTDPERVSERLHLATRAAGIAIWDWDVVKDELVWDDAMYRLFRIRKQDFSGAYDAWANSLAPEDFERVTAEVQAALRGAREFDTEFRIVWPDGSIRHIKVGAQTFFDEKGCPLRMVGVNYDITERKIAEEQINLLHAITLDVVASHDLDSALEVVLRRVCEKTGWALGQAWVPRQDGSGLDCCPAWFATDEKLEAFRSYSMSITILPRRGLPGRVLESRQPVWIRDVTKDLNFPRAEAARKCGLKAALGVPILSGDGIIAVLEFFLSEPREEDERLVKVISSVAAQIGLVCERKLAEDKVRWSEERLRLLLDSTAEGIFGVDLQGRCTFCNAASLRLLGYDDPSDVLGKEMHVLIAHSRADGTPFPMSECKVVRSLEDATIAFSDADVFWRKEGVSFPAAYWSYPIIQENKHIGAVVTFLDITERKLAEESLRLSEERFAKAFQASPEPITISRHRDGVIMEVNERWLSIYGYTREEVVGHSARYFNQISEEDLERLRGLLEKQRSVREFEVDLKTKADKIRHISLSAEQIVIDGELCNIFLHRDITERKLAEEKLKHEQELSETTINSMPGVFYIFDSQGRYLRWNKNFEKVTGYTHQEMTERSPLDFIIDDEHQLISDRIQEVMEAGEATAEASFVAKDGHTIPYFFTGRRVVIEGEPCVVGMGMDITERKRAEEALRESERRFSDTLTNIEMIAVMADMKGDITFCNDYLLRLTDWKREEVIGKNWYEMFLPDTEKSKVSELLDDVQPTGEILLHMENEIKMRSGECRLVQWTNTTLRGPHGEVIGVAALGDDITERKAAEEQLKASTAQLRALSARLQSAREEEGMRIAREIHDELGGALTALKWDLESVDKMLAGSADGRYIQSAQQKIPTMTKLIDETINTVRRISYELRPGVLDDLGLVAAIEWQAQQFEHRTGITCTCVAPWESVDLRQDQATTIFRVFQEILTNVLRHAHATRVDVRMSKHSHCFELEVRDNGRGITEAEKSNTRSLGLLGMRERVQIIEGQIQIDGLTGKGTVVVVNVPIE